ncbi:hypothetical protein GCM10010245_38740 [Streptomyces spectabilis]|nr:hypothetical protein GCM10010245_38740 [Streptomyces spectabilis]
MCDGPPVGGEKPFWEGLTQEEKDPGKPDRRRLGEARAQQAREGRSGEGSVMEKAQ